MTYCCYYQARLNRTKSWFLVAVLRSFEHLVFDRTLDKEESLFEFFVPNNNEPYFLEIMEYMQQQGFVLEVNKMPNRLMTQEVLAEVCYE
jgi:4-hydroxyphenylpyruvate dioxygenase-like putative hemolysin